ncbi:MAG: phytoene desaturase family protein [Crocinitomicaceae bacterium]|nr:phytoene desaturase family protein [Crocinitomicaceae bacterium]
MKKKAIVIGSGLGGLSAAIRLASKGIETHVFESNPFPGGKINSRSIEGYRFDQGPSILTCPEYIEELYTICGEDFSSFEMAKLESSFKYFFDDGVELLLKHDREKVIEEISTKLHEDPKQIENYLNKAEDNYNLIAPLFIEKSLHRWRQLLGKKLIKALLKLPQYKLFSTMDQENSRFFKNKRTAQVFNRFAIYNGSHPYMAPAMLNMISHLEINVGPYLPKRGMIQLTESLTGLAERQGVNFHFNEKVEEIILEGGQTKGVRTSKGKYNTDFIISNMDVSLTYEKLLPNAKHPKKTLEQERSSSAIVFHWGMKESFPELDVHNMVFSDKDEEEFDTIFKEKKVFDEPSIYIYISSKIVKDDAPEGCENWFILINAPINIGQDWDKEIELKREFVIEKLSKRFNRDIRSIIQFEEILDPRTIENKHNGKFGSIYGNASNNRFSAFYRHPNYSKQIKGLYFVGVSVHPGGGIPLALSSSKIATECLYEDFKIH